MSDVRIPLPQLRAYLERCKQDPQTKVALVLSAAAAPGAYQAGVIDALLRARIPIDCIVSSSGGALNGISILLDCLEAPGDQASAVRIWERLSMDQVLSPAWVLRAWQRLQSFSAEPWVQAGAAIGFLPMLIAGLPLIIHNLRKRRALFSSEPLRRLIIATLYDGLKTAPGWRSEAWIGAALSRRWQLAGGPEMIITATSLDAMDAVLFTLAQQETVERLRAAGRKVIPLCSKPAGIDDRPGLLVPALMASSALFPFLPLQRIGNLVLGDGGFLGSTPLEIAIEAGATHVLVVEVDTPANAGKVDRAAMSTLVKRVAATMITSRNRSMQQRINLEGIRCFYLSPSAKFLTFLDFDGCFARGRVVFSLSGQVGYGRRDAAEGFWLDPGSFSNEGLCFTDPWDTNGT